MKLKKNQGRKWYEYIPPIGIGLMVLTILLVMLIGYGCNDNKVSLDVSSESTILNINLLKSYSFTDEDLLNNIEIETDELNIIDNNGEKTLVMDVGDVLKIKNIPENSGQIKIEMNVAKYMLASNTIENDDIEKFTYKAYSSGSEIGSVDINNTSLIMDYSINVDQINVRLNQLLSYSEGYSYFCVDRIYIYELIKE